MTATTIASDALRSHVAKCRQCATHPTKLCNLGIQLTDAAVREAARSKQGMLVGRWRLAPGRLWHGRDTITITERKNHPDGLGGFVYYVEARGVRPQTIPDRVQFGTLMTGATRLAD
jgi:hypothetical protein